MTIDVRAVARLRCPDALVYLVAHALERITSRGIPDDELCRTAHSPDEVRNSSSEEDVELRLKRIGTNILVCVLLKDVRPLVLITAYYED